MKEIDGFNQHDWQQVKEQSEQLIRNSNMSILIAKGTLEMVKIKLAQFPKETEGGDKK